jgi:hypothetical protein
MQVLAVIATVSWFVLNGLLWYMRPTDLQWLFGSLVLGVVYSLGFLWYVTRKR